jgi:thiosulfate reductase cytochrome b subunit
MATEIAEAHSTTTRMTHWIVAASSALLFGSGAAIYNRRPTFRLGQHTFALPHIPSWMTLTASPKLVHYASAAIFVLCGVIYFAWGLRGGHFKNLMMTRADAAKLLPMQLYYLRLRKDPPEYEGYNPLQKLAYSVVLFVIAPLIVLSGAALLPIPMFHPIGAIFAGGVKLWHFGLISLLCLFSIVHVGMVLTTGLAKNMSKMVGVPSLPKKA